MATPGQALGAWDDRIRRSVVAAGLDPKSVLASEYEWLASNKVSVVVMDPQTRKRQFRAIIDLVPKDSDATVRRVVYTLEATDWSTRVILGVYSSRELAQQAMKHRHDEYVEYVASYIGVDPSREDEEYLYEVEDDETKGGDGIMEINERTVDA